MYNGVPASGSGAWASFCLCAYFRALGPAWADVQAESPLFRAWCGRFGEAGSRRTGGQHRKAARVSRAAETDGNTGSAAAVASAEAIPQPRAAGDQQTFRMAFPRVLSGVLRGRRPLFPAKGGGTSRTPAP